MGSFLLSDNCISWFFFNHLFRLTKSFLGIDHTFLTKCHLLVGSLIYSHYWLYLFNYFLVQGRLLTAPTLAIAVNTLAAIAFTSLSLNWLSAFAVHTLTIRTSKVLRYLNLLFCLQRIRRFTISLFSSTLTVHTVTYSTHTSL